MHLFKAYRLAHTLTQKDIHSIQTHAHIYANRHVLTHVLYLIHHSTYAYILLHISTVRSERFTNFLNTMLTE